MNKKLDYKSVKSLAKEYGCCEKTVRTRISGIRQQIKCGRYGRYAVSEGTGRNILVSAAVYADYNTYSKQLENKYARKFVPPFDASEIYRDCGNVVPIRESSGLEEFFAECKRIVEEDHQRTVKRQNEIMAALEKWEEGLHVPDKRQT
ncbi:hypothetical protein [Muricomes intestini]|jgi:hypothetical protein|uniref:hypothetical protein n=1 Tax=Muricomes intestini TaxID=1796634 RepID=UPI002FDEA3B1